MKWRARFFVEYRTAMQRNAAGFPPLHAVFQPIVRLHGDAILGYEALIRGPAGSPLAQPDALFRHAREIGAAFALECEAARVALSAWSALALPGQLFLNFSAQTLRTLLCGAGEGMMDLLTVAGEPVAPERIVIELTEQTATGDMESFARAMETLTERGLRYALDDFGTGHANLDLLVALSPQFVKIDKSLVRGIDACPRRKEILRAVLRMMRAIGGVAIAEGIEDAAALAAVRKLGIVAAQGYYLGGPDATGGARPLSAGQTDISCCTWRAMTCDGSRGAAGTAGTATSSARVLSSTSSR